MIQKETTFVIWGKIYNVANLLRILTHFINYKNILMSFLSYQLNNRLLFESSLYSTLLLQKPYISTCFLWGEKKKIRTGFSLLQKRQTVKTVVSICSAAIKRQYTPQAARVALPSSDLRNYTQHPASSCF